jgi:hypothetical protein
VAPERLGRIRWYTASAQATVHAYHFFPGPLFSMYQCVSSAWMSGEEKTTAGSAS